MTIPQILGNQRYNQLWGQFLTALNPAIRDSVMDRVAKSEALNPDELKFVGYAQLEFTKQVQTMERIEQKFKPKDLEIVLAKQPALATLMRMNGPEVTSAEFIKTMFQVAVQDKTAFSRFATSFERYSDVNATEQARGVEENILALCARNNITRERYDALVDVNDPAGTELRFAQEFRNGRRSLWQRAMDSTEQLLAVRKITLPGSSRDRAVVSTEVVVDHLTVIPRLQDALLRGIAPTIQSDQFQATMARKAFLQPVAVPETERGPKSQAEVDRGRNDYTLQNLERMFDRDIAEHARTLGRDVASFSDAERSDFRDNTWNPPEAEGKAEGFGLWALLLRAIQRLLFAENKSKVRINPNERRA